MVEMGEKVEMEEMEEMDEWLIVMGCYVWGLVGEVFFV